MSGSDSDGGAPTQRERSKGKGRSVFSSDDEDDGPTQRHREDDTQEDLGPTQRDRGDETQADRGLSPTQRDRDDLPTTQVQRDSDDDVGPTQRATGKGSDSEDEPSSGRKTLKKRAVFDESDSDDDRKPKQRKNASGSDASDSERGRRSRSGSPAKSDDEQGKGRMGALFDSDDEEEETKKRARKDSDSEGERRGSESEGEEGGRRRRALSDSEGEERPRGKGKRARRGSLSGDESDASVSDRRGGSGSDSDDDRGRGRGKLHEEIFGGSDDDDKDSDDDRDGGFKGFADDDEDMRIPKKGGKEGRSRKKKGASDGEGGEGEGEGGQSGGREMTDFEKMMEREKKLRNKTRARKRKDEDIDLSAVDDIADKLMNDMREACAADRAANESKKPAVNKIRLLPTVVKELKMGPRTRQQQLIENHILLAVRDWLEPLPDKSLPHISIREAFYEILMDWPVPDRRFLADSKLGKLIMMYTRHPKETVANQRKAKKIINDWSRALFKLPTTYNKLADDEKEDLLRRAATRRAARRGSQDGRQASTNITDAVSGNAERALKPGDEGWRWHARVPLPAQTDYVRAPKPRVNVEELPKGNKKVSRLTNLLTKTKDKKKLGNTRFAVKMSIEGRGL
eukprot:comp22251_c1_seq1/m.32864 comp22251_c1_seq1/g.32864  ORF comp22251_c1_seq1/g.32864 comp22251_c1_seq1/m.32864 type:complete len:627 (-) comp22251_c1_seq1:217-2097(-)